MKLSDLDEKLLRLRERAKTERDPTAPDETLALLMETAQSLHARRILEIGAGEGLTSIALLSCCGAYLTAVECDGARAQRARENFMTFGVSDRVLLIEDDAANVLPAIEGGEIFDLIFLDGPKAQYRHYFDDCKRLLKRGGVLFSDDILLFGYITGEAPQKRRMLAEHIREYINMLEGDRDFETRILEYGEGLAVSVKL